MNSFRMAHSRQICQFNSPTVIPIMDFLNHSKDVSNVEMSQTGTSYKCQATQDIKQVRFMDSYESNGMIQLVKAPLALRPKDFAANFPWDDRFL